ncbi:MAG: glycosyltransferase, partial [Gammaproteobacteria bacterium]|nr:glycosyltransferase [Gammaproteobacteria bacterium]
MSDRIHILNVLLSLEPGGLENGVVNIVNNLNDQRFKTTICCLQVKGEFASRITAKDVDITEWGMKPGNDYGLIWRLSRYIKQLNPDIIHTRNQKAYFHGYAAGRLAGHRKFVHSEHGRTFPGKKRKMRLQGFLSRHTDAVVSVSAQLRRDLEMYAYIPEGKIQVIYNGVDDQRFQSSDRVGTRQQLGFGGSDVVVGIVGRMEPVKNYKLLVEALATLPKGANVHLLAIGDGSERASLEQQARRLGLANQVHFTGYRQDVEKFYAAMDIFVLPSFSEGLSNTLLEAMVSGVAAIGSDVGGNREIITHNETGYLFPSDDQAQLQACLEKCLG